MKQPYHAIDSRGGGYILFCLLMAVLIVGVIRL